MIEGGCEKIGTLDQPRYGEANKLTYYVLKKIHHKNDIFCFRGSFY